MNHASSSHAVFGPGAFRLVLATVVIFQHAEVLALGHWAVLVFFILSGYWVTAMWQQQYLRCRSPYATFLVSRYWRLLPVYLVCYAAAIGLYWFRSPNWPDLLAHLRDPWWVGRVLAIVSSASQDVLLPPVWSLDVEMQFYLALPVLVALVSWAGAARWRGWILLPLAAALYAGRSWGQYTGFFLIGMVLCRWRWQPPRRWAIASAVTVVLAVVLLWLVPASHDLVSRAATLTSNRALYAANLQLSAALALLTVPFIAWNVRIDTRGSLDRHCGNLAYPVYLFHYVPKLACDLMIAHRGWPPVAVLALDLAMAFTGALAIYWIVDRPLDAARRAWVASRRRPGSGSE